MMKFGGALKHAASFALFNNSHRDHLMAGVASSFGEENLAEALQSTPGIPSGPLGILLAGPIFGTLAGSTTMGGGAVGTLAGATAVGGAVVGRAVGHAVHSLTGGIGHLWHHIF